MAQAATDALYQGVPVDPTVDNSALKQKQAAATPAGPTGIPPIPTAMIGAAPAKTAMADLGGTSTAQDALVSSGLKTDTSTLGPSKSAATGTAAAVDPTATTGSPAASPLPTNAGGVPYNPVASPFAIVQDPNGGGPITAAELARRAAQPAQTEQQKAQNFVGSGGDVHDVSGAYTTTPDNKAVFDPTKAAAVTAGAPGAFATTQARQAADLAFSNAAADRFGTAQTQLDKANAAASGAAASAGWYKNPANASATSLPGSFYTPEGQAAAASAEKGTAIDPAATTKSVADNGTSKLTSVDPTTSNGTTGFGQSSLSPVGSALTAQTPAEKLAADKNSYIDPARQTTANNVDPLSGVTSIDPTNDLRSTVITDTPSARTTDLTNLTDQAASGLAGVDRVKQAQSDFDALSKSGDPAYQASLREATQLAAANGQIGSGMLNTNYGSLALNRQRDLDTLKEQLVSQATTGSIADQFQKTSTLSGLAGQSAATDQTGTSNLRGERAYQNSQANDAFTKGLTQYEAEQQAKNTDFSQGLQLLGLGDQGNPSSTLEGAAAQSNPSGDLQSIMALAKQLGIAGGGASGGTGGSAPGTAAASPSGNPEIDALLKAIIARGMPGVQSGTTSTTPASSAADPGVQFTPSTSQLPAVTGPAARPLPDDPNNTVG